MSKTPNLFDVPKTHPTKAERLKAFMEANGFEANYCASLPEAPWMAVHMPSAHKVGEGYGTTDKSDLFDLTAKVGRLLDESGVADYAKTKYEAVRRVCINLDIKFTV
jgi:hypothetical protein